MEYTNHYVVLAIFFLLAIALPIVAWTIGRLLRPSKPYGGEVAPL